MIHAKHNAALLPAASLLATSLLLTACSDPAQRGGAGQALMPDPMPEVVELEQALQSPVIPTVDLAPMHAAEIEKTLGADPWCFFAYTAASPPVLAIRNAGGDAGRGVIKIHGKLVELQQEQAADYQTLAQAAVLETQGGQVRVALASTENLEALTPDKDYAADAVFTLDQGLEVGYRGWYRCDSGSS